MKSCARISASVQPSESQEASNWSARRRFVSGGRLGAKASRGGMPTETIGHGSLDSGTTARALGSDLTVQLAPAIIAQIDDVPMRSVPS